MLNLELVQVEKIDENLRYYRMEPDELQRNEMVGANEDLVCFVVMEMRRLLELVDHFLFRHLVVSTVLEKIFSWPRETFLDFE